MHRHRYHMEISNIIPMMPETPQTITKWLSHEPMHARIQCACMHDLIHMPRHTHHMELYNTNPMIPETPQTVTKWLSYEPMNARIQRACTLACVHGLIHIHRHAHHMEPSNTIPMIPETPQTITKWLSYENMCKIILPACMTKMTFFDPILKI